MSNHPSRQELLKAVETGSVPFKAHLDTCEECREFFALLKAFRVSGPMDLEHAPSGWIDRAIGIGRSKSFADRVRELVATISFDSWSASPALGVRGPATDRRRVRYTAGDLQVDLQAIRKQQQWDFVAHIDISDATAPASLKVGGKRYSPDDDGYITWQAATPPSSMTVLSGDMSIELPQLSWDKPQA